MLRFTTFLLLLIFSAVIPADKTGMIPDNEALFVVIKEIELDGEVIQIESARSYLLVSLKINSSNKTRISAYSFEGELKWQKEFEQDKIVRISASEYSDIVIIKEPIPKENPYDTSLRNCSHSVINERGDAIAEFEHLCLALTPLSTFGYIAFNVASNDNTIAIYDYRKKEFEDFGNPWGRFSIIDSTRLAAFRGHQEIANQEEVDSIRAVHAEKLEHLNLQRRELSRNKRSANADTVRNEINKITNEVRSLRREMAQELRTVVERKISSIELVTLSVLDSAVTTDSIKLTDSSKSLDFGIRFFSRQIDYDPTSQTLALGAIFRISDGPNSSSESKVLFVDEDGEIISAFSNPGSFECLKFLDDSNALILLQTEWPKTFSLFLYDFRNGNIIWEINPVPFGQRKTNFIKLYGNTNQVLIHSEFLLKSPCNTDLMLLDTELGELKCTETFTNREPLYHPGVVTNPGDVTQYAFLNSNKNKLIFAVLNNEK
ncbi:MAG: hypothetical protein WD022_02950 [Balneolaceae bacterium]